MKNYYNTNHESGKTLTLSRARAVRQQDWVLAFFAAHPNEVFAPHEVHNALGHESTPLTSIRRAITNLTDAGRLEKTPILRAGTFGKSVHTWKLHG